MIICEIRKMYDSFGTGNFTEDKTLRNVFDISSDSLPGVFCVHELMGRKRYETSSAIVYLDIQDARHCTEYIYYK